MATQTSRHWFKVGEKIGRLTLIGIGQPCQCGVKTFICSCECVPSIAEAQKKMKEKYSSLVDRWNVEMDKLIIEMHDETGSLFTYDLIWHLDVDGSQSQ